MTASNYMPDVKVEIAFDSGYSTPEGSRTWTDVSEWVELSDRIGIGRGRADELSTIEPSSLSLTLDNTDGRFTAGKADGAYYPNIKIGRPIRVTATPVGGSESVRFTGYVDSWPVAWDGTDTYAMAPITASSRMARLGFDAALGSLLSESILTSQPFAYYPLTSSTADASGSGAIAIPRGPIYPTGSDFSFVESGGPLLAAEGASAICDGAAFESVDLFGSVDTESGVTIEGWFSTTQSSGDPMEICSWSDGQPGLNLFMPIYVDPSDGSVSTTLFLSGGSALGSISSTTGLNDGTLHHAAVSAYRTSGGATTLRLYVDGVEVANDSDSTASFEFTSFNVAAEFKGNVSHVVASPSTSSSMPLEHYLAGTNGFNGDTIDLMVARYAVFGLVNSAELDIDATLETASYVATDGRTALDMLQFMERSEGGTLFDEPDGTLRYVGRTARYTAASEITLDIEAQEVEAEIVPNLDRTLLANDSTVTTADGSAVRVKNQTSIDDYGYANRDFQIAGSQDAALQAASHQVGLYAEPQQRIASLAVDVLPLSAARQADLLGLNIGSRLTVDNFPSQAANATEDFFVEGYDESIGAESYVITYNVSPRFDAYNVWIVEDATYGAITANPLAY